MPNDFEKQVREKMEELDFAPGAPVWTKIEEQIRKKKDRRRVIFWIPFFALLLGGGVLWLSRDNGSDKNALNHQKSASTQTDNLTKNEKAADDASSSDLSSQTNNKRNSTNVVEQNQFNSHPDTSSASVAATKVFHSNPSGVKKYKATNTKIVKEEISTNNSSVDGSMIQHSGKVKNDNSAAIVPVPVEGIRPVDKIESKETRLIEENSVQTTKKDTASTKKNDSIQTVAAASMPKPVPDVSWRFAAVGGIGISGMAEGMHVFGQEKMYDAQSNMVSSPVNTTSHAPASVKNGISFFAGVSVLKNLSKKFLFSAGLEYQYLSTKTQPGMDSLGYSVVQGFMMDPRMRVNNNNQFISQYHFISLPIGIAYQLLKKNPLRISAGLALQQMVSANALVYDSEKHKYETSKDAFSKTQLFSRLGLNYTVDIKNHGLSFGPQLNYGLSNLLKDGDDKRLYSFGLRTAFIF